MLCAELEDQSRESIPADAGDPACLHHEVDRALHHADGAPSDLGAELLDPRHRGVGR